MKIHILYEHGTDLIPHGCSYIRLLLPFAHPNLGGNYQITYGTELDFITADIYVIERLWKPEVITRELAEELVTKLRSKNKRIIYTLDDNLLDLALYRNGTLWPSTELKNIIRFFAREADGIIVSTEKLRERFLHLNNNIVVVKNALDDRLFKNNNKQKKSNGDKRKVIGYMGTHSHDADLMMILPAIRELLSKFKNDIKLEIVGVLADQSILDLFKNLPVKILNVKGNYEYPNFISWMNKSLNWDLAIAPLEDSIFTRSKSDIKFLDYSAWGIPGIYSNVPSYKSSVQHMNNGFLVHNDTSEWYNALEYMVKNDEMRTYIGEKSSEYVYSKRTLKHRANEWAQAIESIIEKRKVLTYI